MKESVAANFEPPFVTITDAVVTHAKWRGGQLALVCETRRVSWGELNENINRVSNGLLATGLQTGDKVAVLMTNCIETVEIMLGAVKAGGCIVPLSAMLGGESLATIIADSNSKFLFIGASLAPVLAEFINEFSNIPAESRFAVGSGIEGYEFYETWKQEFPNQEPRVRLSSVDNFNIIYSSGTTGQPKGIVHTHYARQSFALLLAVEFRVNPASVAIISTPLSSNGTWMLMLPALMIGCGAVIMPSFEPGKFLETIEREHITHAFMVPAQYAVILDSPNFESYDVGSLETLISAAAPLREAMKVQIRQKFNGNLFELYGLTEGIATILRPEQMSGKIASVGTPTFGCDIRILDDNGNELPRGETGEIAGFSPALMRGYYKQPEKTAEAIWTDEGGRTYLKTGDIGRLDADGFLYIVDRKKDMIISGGQNIFPNDLEAVLAKHSAVADVAVISVPHEKWGEAPLALVIKKTSVDGAVSEDDLLVWANERLAKYQRLARVEFCDELPRNALGKVLKKELKKLYFAASRAD